MSDPNCCFTLRVKPDYRKPATIIVNVFDDLGWDSAGRVKLTCEVRWAGEVIFPRKQLHCALHGSSDGLKARELVLSLLAMHPGDGNGVDDDFYEGYSKEQLDFVITHGEAIDMERQSRYCDSETGECRKEKS